MFFNLDKRWRHNTDDVTSSAEARCNITSRPRFLVDSRCSIGSCAKYTRTHSRSSSSIERSTHAYTDRQTHQNYCVVSNSSVNPRTSRTDGPSFSIHPFDQNDLRGSGGATAATTKDRIARPPAMTTDRDYDGCTAVPH